MNVVQETHPPADSLIEPFGNAEAHYTDAFRVRVDEDVALPAFIEAFYTTPLFKAERLILRFLARRPSTDADARALACGQVEQFAVWRLDGRSDWDILLAESSGRTKSWLAVQPAEDGTDLWFGSVVIPVEQRGKLALGPVFDTLLGAHVVYSRALLAAAARRVLTHPAEAQKRPV